MKKLVINANLLLEEVEDNEAIIIDSDRGVTHVLNQTATMLYKCCCSESTVEEIIERFAAFFDATAEEKNEIKKDAEEQIAIFIDSGIASLIGD